MLVIMVTPVKTLHRPKSFLGTDNMYFDVVHFCKGYRDSCCMKLVLDRKQK